MKTLYDILEVEPTVSQEEIKAAYRKVAERSHPDRFMGDQERWFHANESLLRINEAYATLKDTSKRAAYDREIGIRRPNPGGGRIYNSGNFRNPPTPWPAAHTYDPAPEPPPPPREARPEPATPPAPEPPCHEEPAPEPVVAESTNYRVNPRDGAEMLWIPPGPFLAGDANQSNNPRVEVGLEGYWIYRYPVTVSQYRKFCKETGASMPRGVGKDDFPVTNVSWEDCTTYCKWAGVRLPTDREWEKAARGVTGLQYPWGDRFDASKLVSSSEKWQSGPAPVNRKQQTGPSPFGVIDMAGNVWQWCADEYRPGSKTYVRRGGSWFDDIPTVFRSSYRTFSERDYRHGTLGFRCVVS